MKNKNPYTFCQLKFYLSNDELSFKPGGCYLFQLLQFCWWGHRWLKLFNLLSGKPAKHFTEGWIEFLSKRIAKDVAAKLNNTMIGGRKKSRYYDYIWNLKYLPR